MEERLQLASRICDTRQAEIDRLREENLGHVMEIADLLDDKEERKAETNRLREERNNLRRDTIRLRNERNDLRGERDHLRDERDDLERERDELLSTQADQVEAEDSRTLEENDCVIRENSRLVETGMEDDERGSGQEIATVETRLDAPVPLPVVELTIDNFVWEREGIDAHVFDDNGALEDNASLMPAPKVSYDIPDTDFGILESPVQLLFYLPDPKGDTCKLKHLHDFPKDVRETLLGNFREMVGRSDASRSAFRKMCNLNLTNHEKHIKSQRCISRLLIVSYDKPQYTTEGSQAACQRCVNNAPCLCRRLRKTDDDSLAIVFYRHPRKMYHPDTEEWKEAAYWMGESKK
ncbi:hypothetical protein M011DRAFT_473653 [Sporormia fimetaria CBS 119925]|uniref:Uncharacterized protein n=1 Tax=Sporormia fimetaria CBS 119925 TaxID=1340428 RepID=A0A6A6VMU5_9PLEO|nr:hypothetical protein M011DRAFT_473653 [Sporormia fimetaria CBS 119925]